MRLDKIWDEVRPAYTAEVEQHNLEKMSRQMSLLWEYLRMERSDSYVIVHVPNLLDACCMAIGAQYENYYYNVESPGAISHALNCHEYLHSIVKPMVQSQYKDYKGKLREYYKTGRKGPLSKHYQHPVGFTEECLIRALDHRLRLKMAEGSATQKHVEQRIAELTEEGLTLVRPLYLLLSDFEAGNQRFEEYLPVMLEKLPKYDD